MTSGIPRSVFTVLTSCLLLLCVSCQGTSASEGVGVQEPAGALSAEEEQALEARAAVERLVRTGDYRAALVTADLALEELKPSVHTSAIRRMRRVAWDEHVRRDLIRTDIQFENQRVTIGQPIRGAYVIENRSGEPLVVSAEARGTESGGARRVVSRSRFRIMIEFEEHHIDGTLASESWTEVRGLDEDVSLEPGESHAFPIEVMSDTFSLESVNYRTYSVSVRLHPARLSIGRGRSTIPLDFPKRSVAVLPKNWEHLAVNSLQRIDQAIEKESPVHLPLAAALVTLPHRPAAIDRLVEMLETPDHLPPAPPVRIAGCVALRILTAENLPARPDAWREWSRQR